MIWYRRFCTWVEINLLEGKLQRKGYRRLHEIQVADASVRTKRIIHDVADAIIMLQTVADEVEHALLDLEGPDDN